MKQIFKTVFATVVAVIMIAMIAVPAFAATPAPNFSSGEYVDLLPFMKEEKYGKQQDDEDGVRMNLTKNNSGFTAKFNSQAVNYGVRFNTDIYNQDGAMYIQCVLDSEQDLWDGVNAKIYGGPVIQLGYGSVSWGGDYSGYFSLIFTEQDGIDLRLSDKIGNDLAYIGAANASLKVDYPDTNSKNRGKKDYLVQIKFTKKDLTVWVNGIAVIDGVKFDSVYSKEGYKIPMTVERLEAGMHSNASRTTIHDFRLYCLKADVAGDAAKADTNQGNNAGAGSNTTSATTSNTTANTTSNTTSTDETTGENTDAENIVDGDSDVTTNTDKDYVLVKGEKVKFFNWQIPVIISAIIVFAFGAIFIGVYTIITNRKK